MKIYFIANTDGEIIDVNNPYNLLLRTLLLYDKYVSTTNNIDESDFIIIDGYIRSIDYIDKFNHFKSAYLKHKIKTVIFIMTNIIEEESRILYYNTDLKYNTIFDDNYIYFTALNVPSKENIIFLPFGPIPPEMINNDYLANIDLLQNVNFYDKIYFKGSPTHAIRNIACDYFKTKEKCDITLQNSISYFWNKIQSQEYQNHYQQHITNCMHSDINLLIRGDREICYIFCDYLYCGNIICFINANMYKCIGLEKFGLDNIFYFFDINETPLECIYDTLINCLQNKETVCNNKIKIREFYNSFIKVDKAYSKKYSYHGGYQGFTHFIVYKLYNILKNNYTLINNKILDPDATKVVDTCS
jgi:hypothetical protein